MKLHRYVDHQRLHIVTKDVISLSISVLLLFRHYISHKITFGAPSSGGVLCSACGAFILCSTYQNIPQVNIVQFTVDKNIPERKIRSSGLNTEIQKCSTQLSVKFIMLINVKMPTLA